MTLDGSTLTLESFTLNALDGALPPEVQAATQLAGFRDALLTVLQTQFNGVQLMSPAGRALAPEPSIDLVAYVPLSLRGSLPIIRLV